MVRWLEVKMQLDDKVRQLDGNLQWDEKLLKQLDGKYRWDSWMKK